MGFNRLTFFLKLKAMIKYSKVTFTDGSTGVVMDKELPTLKEAGLIKGDVKSAPPSPAINEPKKPKAEEVEAHQPGKPKPVNIGSKNVKK